MQFRYAFTVGLLAVTASGCFHGGYPNGGYYSPGPSVVPQQPSTGFPGAPFYGSPMNGSPYVPGNSPGTGGPTPIYTNPGGGSNGTYESPSGSNGNSPGFNETAPSGSKSVPLPADDPSMERGTQRPQLTPTSSMSPNQTEFDESPVMNAESRRRPRPEYDATASVVEEEEDVFQAPSVRQTSSVEDAAEEVQFADAPQRVRAIPYGHHPEFEWVQGVVDYDDATRTWSILYDDQPKATDQLGGDLTLAPHPELKRLQSGMVVRMEGSIDETVGDSRGKPVFRVAKLKKL